MNNLYEKCKLLKSTKKEVDDFFFWQYGWLDMLNDPSAKIKLVLRQSMTRIIFSSFSGSFSRKQDNH